MGPAAECQISAVLLCLQLRVSWRLCCATRGSGLSVLNCLIKSQKRQEIGNDNMSVMLTEIFGALVLLSAGKEGGRSAGPVPTGSARSRLSSSVHTPGCLGSRCATRGRETWAMTFTRCLPFNYTVKETSVLFPNCLFESGVMCCAKNSQPLSWCGRLWARCPDGEHIGALAVLPLFCHSACSLFPTC